MSEPPKPPSPKLTGIKQIDELTYKMPEQRPLRETPVIRIDQVPDDGRFELEEEEDDVDINELGDDEPALPSGKNRADTDKLQVNPGGFQGFPMRKSYSLTSISSRVKQKVDRLKNNQIAGVIFFLIVGLVCSVASYLMSVYAAQLNKEVIEITVANQETIAKKLKKTLMEGPSKYLIGAFNFGGRMLSSIGTVMLVQVIVTYVKRRRYNLVLRSAAGEADQVVGEVHTGVTDAAGEMIMTCIQAFN